MVDEFIARANIEHFRNLLATEGMDEARRKVVLELLAEEERKLAVLRQHEPSKRGCRR